MEEGGINSRKLFRVLVEKSMTIEEWHKELASIDPKAAELFMYNITKSTKFNRFPNPRKFRFMDLFVWKHTKEGHDYWSDLNKRLNREDIW